MPIVKYTDDNEWMWAVLVLDGTPKANYCEGALLGATDLSPLGLSLEQMRLLHNALVENDLYAAPLMMGKRKILKQIITDLGLALDVRALLHLFQQDYYGA